MVGVWRASAARLDAPQDSDIVGYAVLTLVFREAGGVWTAECRELGTATDGTTLQEVHSQLVDLIVLHLNALESSGERERFFERHGIKLYRPDATPAAVQRQVPVDENAFVHTHRIPLKKSA